ncbi:MAG: hypothetical protein ACI8S6_000564 [Myxococcota bacterium]|jgi:hypothetical protein
MLSVLIWLGCGTVPEEAVAPPVEAVAVTDPALLEIEAVAAAEAAAKAAGGALKKRLMSALAEGGPEHAVGVCADEAQGLTALSLVGQRARAGRASLRTRNPGNVGPEWVAAWLTEQGERPAAGVTGLSSAHRDGDVVVGRFLAPIPVEAPCLSCHGGPDQIAPAVAAVLSERYPKDQAVGYAEGDLRGALWAEVRLPVVVE